MGTPAKISLNDVAKHVTCMEGGKVNLSIAQVKEVQRVLSVFCYLNPLIVSALIKNGEMVYNKLSETEKSNYEGCVHE